MKDYNYEFFIQIVTLIIGFGAMLSILGHVYIGVFLMALTITTTFIWLCVCEAKHVSLKNVMLLALLNWSNWYMVMLIGVQS